MIYKLPREMRVREFMNCKAQTCCAVYPTYCTSIKCPQSINRKHGASMVHLKFTLCAYERYCTGLNCIVTF